MAKRIKESVTIARTVFIRSDFSFLAFSATNFSSTKTSPLIKAFCLRALS